MKILKFAVALTQEDTHQGQAYQSGTRTGDFCSCSCYQSELRRGLHERDVDSSLFCLKETQYGI